MPRPHLTDTIHVRVEHELRVELERHATTVDRTPSAVARVFLREGLERRRKAAERRLRHA